VGLLGGTLGDGLPLVQLRQRDSANLPMLEHAFDMLGCVVLLDGPVDR